jgi:hypothetical protein
LSKSPSETEFVKPSKPDATLIDLIHRRNDGYIAFARKQENGTFENICAIPANRLPGLFADEMQGLTERDGFFTVNAMYRTYHTPNKFGLTDTDGQLLKIARRSSNDLRYLTACFVDLDCHSKGISVGQAIGAVIDAQDSNAIPPPSVLARSGRGVWCLWLLVDKEGGLQKGFADQERVWARIQNTLTSRLATLAADEKARDSSRLTRIPGSLNSKANKRVDYWLQADSEGRTITYTLDELRQRLQLPAEGKRAMVFVTGTVASKTKRARKGQRARWEWDWKTFWQLVERREQIKVGQRHFTLMVCGLIIGKLFKVDAREDVIRDAMNRLFNRIQNPSGDKLTLDEMYKVLKSNAYKKQSSQNIKHQTIADWLEITPDESEVLPVLLNRKTSWPCARAFQLGDVGYKKREDVARDRQAALRRFAGGARVPPLREIQTYLEQLGIGASPRTIQKDLAALNIRTGRERSKSGDPAPKDSGHQLNLLDPPSSE